jgi:hypothetical protein
VAVVNENEPADSIVAFTLEVARTTTLSLEPEGMSYEVRPSQPIELRIVLPQDPPHIEQLGDGGIVIYHDGFAAVFIDGVDVDSRLPTKREIAWFASDEYKEQERKRSERAARVEEVRQRYMEENPEEFRRVMMKLIETASRGSVTPEQWKDALDGADPELVNALLDSGVVPVVREDLGL